MSYHANLNKKHLIPYVFFLLVTSAILLKNDPYLLPLIFFYLICLILVFLQFHLKINHDNLEYKIKLFTLPIYQKRSLPDEIKFIKFKRVNWAQKSALIKTSKLFSLRITNFIPKNIYNNLAQFAENNNIIVLKTKDFQTLLKMDENQENH